MGTDLTTAREALVRVARKVRNVPDKSDLSERMSERHWDIFADLLTRIVDASGSWQEKAHLLSAKMRERDAETHLAELAEWATEFGEPVD